MQNTHTRIWYQVATTIRAPRCKPEYTVYLHLSCFLPWGGYLSSHLWIMSTISHSITLQPGWQSHSKPSSMSGCTYSTCSAFYLPTDRPLTCENIFLHRAEGVFTILCDHATTLPWKKCCTSKIFLSIIWVHSPDVRQNCQVVEAGRFEGLDSMAMAASVRTTSDSNDGPPKRQRETKPW